MTDSFVAGMLTNAENAEHRQGASGTYGWAFWRLPLPQPSLLQSSSTEGDTATSSINYLSGKWQQSSGTIDGTGFCLAPFDPATPAEVLSGQLVTGLTSLTLPIPDVELTDWNEAPFAEASNLAHQQWQYEALVQHSVDAINAGYFSKLVCSHPLDLDQALTLADQQRLFQQLVETYPKAFVYWAHHPQWGTWMAATPETLLRQESNTLHTHALAGTLPRKQVEQALAAGTNPWSAKEVAEHQHVIDYIKVQLATLDANFQVEVAATHTVYAGPVAHLQSDIALHYQAGEVVKGAHTTSGVFSKVVKALHPTSATCGSPRETSLEFLRTHEGYDRELYAGYVGVVDQESSTLFVNLRCLKLQPGRIRLYVGAGITAGSIPAKEWAETLAKAETLLGPLNKVLKVRAAV